MATLGRAISIAATAFENKIDKAIGHIDSISHFVIEDEITDAKYHADNANAYLKDIRTANTTLRDWGNDMSDQRDELEEENNDLENLLTTAKEDINDLKKEIEELQKELQELEETYKY